MPAAGTPCWPRPLWQYPPSPPHSATPPQMPYPGHAYSECNPVGHAHSSHTPWTIISADYVPAGYAHSKRTVPGYAHSDSNPLGHAHSDHMCPATPTLIHRARPCPLTVILLAKLTLTRPHGLYFLLAMPLLAMPTLTTPTDHTFCWSRPP